MAGKYRALLIGNSTYPADEHNLQPLKGPVKDIAALNRALVDSDTGLFSDADVTLLAETSSTRALRAMSRFFAAAERDDVLLVYFSGHGKLDQSGRLHLCMQDTESTDLLSTAVSSSRINEFVDASRARNVVIVLDCCHAGAFRGSDFGEAVAGPGRYVLTSCRRTQLANDATIENGTSYFTQHLIEGLVGAAIDNDGDGYVGFSDVYAYVDRRLREEGKQIPQRRVDGDGDLRLARRLSSASGPAPVLDGSPSAPATAAPTAGSASALRAHTRLLIGSAIVAVGVAAGVVTAILVANNGDPPKDGSPSTHQPVDGSYTSAGPWRLQLENDINPETEGCDVTLIDPKSGARTALFDDVFDRATAQVAETGLVRWQTNNVACRVTPVVGSGLISLPALILAARGDTDAFTAPAEVAVQVTDFAGNTSCVLQLHDAATGALLDAATAKPGAGSSQLLHPGSATKTYLYPDYCGVRISAAR